MVSSCGLCDTSKLAVKRFGGGGRGQYQGVHINIFKILESFSETNQCVVILNLDLKMGKREPLMVLQC